MPHWKRPTGGSLMGKGMPVIHGVSTQDMPYKLLKSYGIAPLRSGTMARYEHISLRHHRARVGPTGLLQVPADLVDRVWLTQLAVELLPRGARREVFQVLEFLGKVRANSHADILAKAASILVDQLLEELVDTGVVARRRV